MASSTRAPPSSSSAGQEGEPSSSSSSLVGVLEEARELARLVSVRAGLVLLEGAQAQHQHRALYWVARAKLEQQQVRPSVPVCLTQTDRQTGW